MGRLTLLRRPPSVSFLDFTGTDSAVASEAASVVVPGTITQFYNSSQPGGTGTDSDVLWADDLSNRPWCAEVDFDTAVALYGGPATTAGIQHTAGWGGTIYDHSGYPWPRVTAGFAGMQYMLTHGVQPDGVGGRPPNGADYMGDHDLVRGVTEMYCYWEEYYLPGYLFGAEKRWDINPPNWLGNGGIIWGNFHNNLGGSPASSCGVSWQGTTGPSRSLGFTITSGRVYAHQLYLKRGTGGNDGILRYWGDDLGAARTSIPTGRNMTLRYNETTYPFNPATGSHTQFGNIWVESWANLPSSGTSYRGNMMVREFNGGSNGNSPMLIAA